MAARFVERAQRDVERLHGRLDQRGRLRGTPFEAPYRGRQRRHRRTAAGHRIVRIAQIAGDLLDLHHGGAPVGEARFLAGLRPELVQLIDGVTQPVRLALRALDLGTQIGQRGILRAPLLPQPRHLARVALERPVGIEQRTMARHIDQGTLIVLAVNFDQRPHRAHATPAR